MFANLRREIRTPSVVSVLLLLATLATGCGSGGGADLGILPAGLSASFSDSGTAAAADGIRISGSPTDDLVHVEVSIGGPTTSADLYSFAFDLILGDSTVAEYVTGSATAGTALTTDAGQAVQVLATRQADRITIGVTKLGGGTGNGITGTGESTVVGLTFRVLRVGTTTLTIEGSPGTDPAALDSSGDEIGSVTFDTVAATLLGI